MKTLFEQILDLKTEAKNQRDRGLKGYKAARSRLSAAIGLAGQGLAQTSVSDVRRQFAKELADCHGMVGGVERRWAIEGPEEERGSHLGASCCAYDAGFGYEWDPQYDIRASYNLVNRLTGRLMMRPELLEVEDLVVLGAGIEPLNLPSKLGEAIDLIDLHLAKKGNFWAEADLALLNVLLGRADAESAYAPFNELSPPAYAYTSALDGLRPLAALPMKTAQALKAAVTVLEARLRRS